jgi:MscS family membrane protein
MRNATQIFKCLAFCGCFLVTIAYGQDTSNETLAQTRLQGDSSLDVQENVHPLKPADTSSPRDTLLGFIADVDQLFAEWKDAGAIESASAYQVYSRALSALDFSTTPDSSSRYVREERMFMLREILNRLDIPPDNEIPGDEEVSEGGVIEWTVPNTSIIIQRVEHGPREHEFLFSHATVERIDQFYRTVEDLPYRPGGSPGIYEAYLRSKNTGFSLERQIRNRLRPVDMSSPRSTLEGFLESVNRAFEIVMETEAALIADPPTIARKEAREKEVAAKNLMERAIATLDLSGVPEALRDDVGMERALQLKEIFDRMNLPPIDAVPNVDMVRRMKLSQVELGAGMPVRWRYPNTAIEIVEMVEGKHQGSFRFSAETVNNLDGYYREVRNLPYRDDYSQIALEYPSPGVSKGFYDYYISTPGSLIPRSTLMGSLIDSLPAPLKSMYHGQAVWQWIGLFLCTLAVVLISSLVWFACRRVALRWNSPWDQWLRIAPPALTALFVSFAINFVDEDLNLTGSVLNAVTTVGHSIVIVLTALLAFKVCRAIADTVIALPQISDESINASLVRLSSSLIGMGLFAWILVGGLNNLGFDMIPLIAGLGVGGLAVALAARSTVENIIGSLMIFWDGPYKVGQRIKVLGHDGVVESIGLRSTKIRLLTGHLTSIPNEKMASAEIENIGRRPYIRRLLNVNITYDTPPKKINRAIEICREILAVPESTEPDLSHSSDESQDAESSSEGLEREPHPNDAINQPEFPPRVYFSELNTDSLNLLVIYWYHPAEYWDYLQHATWINMQIMERFEAEGIDFAFPTQTLHLESNDKRPLTIEQRWESSESNLTSNALVAQAAAYGAQSVLAQQTAASDAVRPEGNPEPAGKVEGELTDAPIEDEMMHGDEDGEPDADLP